MTPGDRQHIARLVRAGRIDQARELCACLGVPLQLQGVDLTGADLTDANLTDTNLTGADLDMALLTRAIMPEGWQALTLGHSGSTITEGGAP